MKTVPMFAYNKKKQHKNAALLFSFFLVSQVGFWKSFHFHNLRTCIRKNDKVFIFGKNIDYYSQQA